MTDQDKALTATARMLIDTQKLYCNKNCCDSLDDIPESVAIGWLLHSADRLSHSYSMRRVEGCVIVVDDSVVIGGIYGNEDHDVCHAFCYFGG